MSPIEIAAMLVAVAFVVLVGCLVPVLIQLRKTVGESEHLLSKMSAEVLAFVSELRSMSHNLNRLTEQARGGIEHASVLLHAGVLLVGYATFEVVRTVTTVQREQIIIPDAQIVEGGGGGRRAESGAADGSEHGGEREDGRGEVHHRDRQGIRGIHRRGNILLHPTPPRGGAFEKALPRLG